MLGHFICTGLAVICGALIAKKISVRMVTLIGALVFIGFAVASLFIDPYEENHLVPDVEVKNRNSKYLGIVKIDWCFNVSVWSIKRCFYFFYWLFSFRAMTTIRQFSFKIILSLWNLQLLLQNLSSVDQNEWIFIDRKRDN